MTKKPPALHCSASASGFRLELALAAVLALGGDRLAAIAVLREQSDLAGPVASVPFWLAAGAGVPGGYRQRGMCPHRGQGQEPSRIARGSAGGSTGSVCYAGSA